MIDVGRKRPAFFLCGEARKGEAQLVGPARDPAKQDPAVPAFHDIAGAGRKGRETGRREWERKKVGGWKKMENYLLNK